MESGQGDWPSDLLFHAGGAKPGGWVVFEMWESREAQDRFMRDRLGRALQAGGISGPPTRVEWLDLAAHHRPRPTHHAAGAGVAVADRPGIIRRGGSTLFPGPREVA
jgi:hypothetical protein